jgi:hypothetical protein
MRQRRGSLYLLTGLILGFVIGLVFAWAPQPAVVEDSAPSSLEAQAKDQYRALIATAFAAGGDLVRAEARLELLGDKDPYAAVVEQIKRQAPAGETSELTALRLLAAALSEEQKR